MNIELLRRKRVKRLGVKTSNHVGQRRIFFILDRATRKLQGDIGLWMQYLTFARKQKSSKKVSQILTTVLRLHPTKAELWIYAANYAMDDRGDMMEARSYMQRGLRFCKDVRKIWIEYARLELIWVAKIWARRKILGVDEDRKEINGTMCCDTEGIDGDILTLPKVTEEDTHPHDLSTQEVDRKALETMNKSPALSGAIPTAIFDSAMKQFEKDEILGLQFFDMVSEFHELPCSEMILDHITEVLERSQSPAIFIRYIRQPIIGLSVTSASFPSMLGFSLDRMKTAFDRLASLAASADMGQSGNGLNGKVIEWLLPYLEEKDLNADVRKVILMTIRKVWSQLQEDTTAKANCRPEEVMRLIGKFKALGLHKLAKSATEWAIER